MAPKCIRYSEVPLYSHQQGEGTRGYMTTKLACILNLCTLGPAILSNTHMHACIVDMVLFFFWSRQFYYTVEPLIKDHDSLSRKDSL